MKGYNFKAGDMVRCKKDYYDPKFPRVLFYKNNYYIVDEKECKEGIYLKMMTGNPEYLALTSGQIIRKEGQMFHQFYAVFQDYFYSNEEDRKLKIEKLIKNE
jgi:hypothetical protein